MLCLRRAMGPLAVVLLLAVAPVQAQVVISQVYGGGGSTTGSPSYKRDYVELFNAGGATASLAGLSVQYGSATGTGNWSLAVSLSGSMAPGEYRLVGLGTASGALGQDLPTVDFSGSTAMSASSGKVALATSTTPLTGACPATGILDVVGYGSANCSESSPTAGLSSILAAVRASGGCFDTNINNVDFNVTTPAPRNAATAANACNISTPTSPSGTGLASPSLVSTGESTLLTVAVTPGLNPTSTALAVVGNLSAIGGAADQAFYDDGSHGDATAGDRMFSFVTSIAGGTSTGAKIIGIGVADGQSRSASLSISVNVTNITRIHDIQGGGTVSPIVGTDVTKIGRAHV